MSKKKVAGRVLGELESVIMGIIWRHKQPIAVKDVTELLRKKRMVAYTTVMTVMNRLVEKGVLVRNLNGASYLYKPRLTREKFIANAVHRIFSSIVSNLGEETVVHFIREIKKINPEKKEELIKILDYEENRS